MMDDKVKLNHPWLVAVWPGMGHVALNAGYYLLAKLGMRQLAEFEARDLFDVELVMVKDGIIQKGRWPRNRFFLWSDPEKKHDIVVFLGEAQPPVGKYLFCQKIIEYAQQLGAERIFTFAAMATQMHPSQPSRVFAAATGLEGLEDLKRLELEVLEDGHIGGLNGVLLGAAAESNLRGACLLGEMPHLFTQVPYPKASLAILEVFAVIAHVEIDFTELAEQARLMDEQLEQVLSRIEKSEEVEEEEEATEEPANEEEEKEEDGPDPAQRQRIEKLFSRAEKDRSVAFELKQELDRLGVFKDYEDRFLDLFKKE
jgi:proteasome assembly chaperone (PAC2) family protein